MVEKQIVTYIKESQAHNVSLVGIRQALLNSGWSAQQIDEAIAVAVPSSAPIAPKAPPAPTIVWKSSPASIYSRLLMPVLLVSLFILVNKTVSDLDDHFAPYAHNTFEQTRESKDIGAQIAINPQEATQNSVRYVWAQQSYTKLHDHDVSRKLILNTGIVLPIWLLTFVLYSIFRAYKDKFFILLIPYTLVSGWLLITLLYDVSTYILNQNTAFGVYIVLAMVVLVLTAVIVGIQKYTHRDTVLN